MTRHNTTPKRNGQATNKTKIKGEVLARSNGAATNGSKGASASRTKASRSMTLDELSLRAYKMTYKRLHGSKKTQK